MNIICTRSVVVHQGLLLEGDRSLNTIFKKKHEKMFQFEHSHSYRYTPPGWLPVRASEDWRQISVKPAAAATPAAVVLMQ